MEVNVDFESVDPKNLEKHDYVILKNGDIARIVKETDKGYLVLSPKDSFLNQSKIEILKEDIDKKLELWAYDDTNIPIARISKKATFVKQGDTVKGWVHRIPTFGHNYIKVFMVKCPCCNNTF